MTHITSHFEMPHLSQLETWQASRISAEDIEVEREREGRRSDFVPSETKQMLQKKVA